MNKDEIVLSDVITGYYHGLYYYLVVIDPFNYKLDSMIKTMKKFDRHVKLLAPIPSRDIDFKEYILKYNITNYFINPYTYKVKLFTDEKIDTQKIFEEIGYYCEIKRPLTSSISLKIEKLYYANYDKIYNLKKLCCQVLKSQNSEYFLFTPIGGGNEIGRSCYLFKTEFSKILVDVGMGFKDNTRIPQFDAHISDFNDLTGVFITHPHLDHLGNIILLINSGYKGAIYMTYACLKLAYISLLDCLKLFIQNQQTPHFTRTDVDKFVTHVIIINYNQKITLSKDIIVVPKYSCHILGGCMLEFNVGNKCYLFTSDFNSYTPGVELLKPYKLKTEYEQIISEGTNLTKISDYSLLEPKLIESITFVKNNLGILLMPCLLYGRGHEILYNLINLFIKYPDLQLPIYITKSVYEIGQIYLEHVHRLSIKGFNFINSSLIKTYTQVIEEEEDELIILESSGIIIAPSGMLEGGSAVKWLTRIIQESNNMCLLSCYQPPGTLGYELQKSEPNTMVNIYLNNELEKRTVRCRVGTISPYFGAHITKDKLQQVLNLSKRYPIIVHTSTHKEKKEKYIILKNLETFRLI